MLPLKLYSDKESSTAPNSAGDRRKNIRICMVAMNRNPDLLRFCKSGYHYWKISNAAGLQMTGTLLFDLIFFYSKLPSR